MQAPPAAGVRVGGLTGVSGGGVCGLGVAVTAAGVAGAGVGPVPTTDQVQKVEGPVPGTEQETLHFRPRGSAACVIGT